MIRVRVTIDGKTDREVDVDRDLIVGRAADCDIQVKSSEVSSRHAKLHVSGGDLFVVDLGSTNGTTLDGGERLSANKQTAFGRGQKLVMGPAVIEVVADAGGEDSAENLERGATVVIGGGEQQALLVNIARFKAAEPRLVIAAEHERRVVPLEEMEATVGRDDPNDIVITHDSVSSRHAKLVFTNGRFFLHDLGSSNGSFLDGNPVAAPTPIPHEAALTFGTIECLFVQKAPEQGAGGDRHSDAIVQYVVKHGKATEQQGREVLGEHRQSGVSLGEAFVSRGIMSPGDWSEIYRQRQIIGTLAPATAGGGGSMKGAVIAIVVVAIVVGILFAAGVLG